MNPACIITGAGRGIGAAVARELGRCGYSLLLVSRSGAELDAVASELPAARVCVADVRGAGEAARIVGECLAAFGRIDALVNNAGCAPVVPIARMSDAAWEEVIETNLGSTFRLTREVWPHFERQKSGTIVNLSSLASRDPFPGFGAYAAAKAAINLFSRVSAREGAAVGIRVHTIAPGAVETRMLRAAVPEAVLPPSKVLAPEVVAALIGRCVRGELSHTSGEVLYIHNQL
jgi:NAD(P)-dependent dehydrogenase (short-subunit alcohol dehydrogenase family)